jgi:hypothetical protein
MDEQSLKDPEQALQDRMAQRIQRAAEELHAAIWDMRMIAVATPQRGEVKQWRWRWDSAWRQALGRVKEAAT